ncbi:MAG: single-stranded-DNA-specific exonuclease RecJ [Cellvibrionaceae bacterium]|nr:single-stranded-DNA-specific exonuclease RecJ [Cellvibrionaceae bacterium]
MPRLQQRSLAPATFSDAVPPLLQRVYAGRGLTEDRETDYGLQQLQPPIFKGLSAALKRLQQAFRQQQSVLIVGDFDADGASSCAVGLLALRAMGLQQVNYLVPNRFEYGYGLTPEIVTEASRLDPQLIITVDNGIASVEGVERARTLGIDVIITDHHLAPTKLPEAVAIVNPNQPGCEFPSKNLAGVGVIFYLMTALRKALRKANWFTQQSLAEPKLAELLDLVALGTVADVVPLDHNNRVLVHQGIARIRAGKTRPGIHALIDVAGRQHQRLHSSDLGFMLGPRLNAAGRLDDMSIGIECLLTDNPDTAMALARQLDGLNRDRRTIENAMQQEAQQALDALTLSATALPWGLCLFEESWHQGVIGILASRIKEKYYRPVIAFAPVDKHQLKGSARSIPGLHIRDVLDGIATANPHILQKFGGHAMAAGLSLERQHYPTFLTLFDRQVRKHLCEQDLQESILTDGQLAATDMLLDNAHLLQQAGPWGQAFPEPLFDGEFTLLQQKRVGEKHLKMVLACSDNPQHHIDAIAFNIAPDSWPDESVNRVQLVYQLSVNHYRGMDSLQLIVRHLDAVDA